MVPQLLRTATIFLEQSKSSESSCHFNKRLSPAQSDRPTWDGNNKNNNWLVTNQKHQFRRFFQSVDSQSQFWESRTLINESCFWDAAAVKVFSNNGDQQAAEQFWALVKGKIWGVYAWDKGKCSCILISSQFKISKMEFAHFPEKNPRKKRKSEKKKSYRT